MVYLYFYKATTVKYVILLLVLCSISVRLTAQNVNELIGQGSELLFQKKYDSALILVNKARHLDSTAYHVYTLRGAIYFEMQKWEEAYLDFSNAISKYPDSSFAYHRRALLFVKLNYVNEAIGDNTKALELVTDDTSRLMLFLNRGNAFGQKRDFQHAYEDYSRAYLLDSNNKEVLNNMATVLDELGRRDEAIAQLKKLASIDPKYLGAYVNLGYQYTKLGKYKEAIEYFDKALLLEKDEPLTLNNRGHARYFLHDHRGALEDINKSIHLYPANSYAYKNRALVFLALNEKDKACADIQQAITYGFTEMYGPEVVELKKLHCPVVK